MAIHNKITVIKRRTKHTKMLYLKLKFCTYKLITSCLELFLTAGTWIFRYICGGGVNHANTEQTKLAWKEQNGARGAQNYNNREFALRSGILTVLGQNPHFGTCIKFPSQKYVVSLRIISVLCGNVTAADQNKHFIVTSFTILTC